mgnify:CR=1 FL=1
MLSMAEFDFFTTEFRICKIRSCNHVFSEKALHRDAACRWPGQPSALPDGEYDMIVSNPPYIPSEDIKSLSDEVKNEPMLALDGGIDGLDIVRALIEKAPRSIKKGGYLLIEFGYDQGAQISSIMEEKLSQGEYSFYKIVKDYGGNDRALVARV